MGFPSVRYIEDGMQVNADITNRPLRDLTERTNWLKDQIDNVLLDNTRIMVTEVKCSDEVKDSQLVYLDPDTGLWAPAVAEVITQEGQQYISKKAYIQGIAKNIQGAPGSKYCDVYFFGIITGLNLINFLEENEIRIGVPLYLTGKNTKAGQCTYQAPAIEIFIGKFIEEDKFLFTPDTRTLTDRHRHIWVQLEYNNFTPIVTDEELTGIFSFSNNSTIVTGTNTIFTTELSPDQWIHSVSEFYPVKIKNILSDTQLELYTPYLGSTHQGNAKIWTGHYLYHYSHLPIYPPISYTSALLVVNGVVYFYGDKFYLSADGVHYIDPDYPPQPNEDIWQAILYYQVPFGNDTEPVTEEGVTSLYARTQNLRIYKQGTTVPASTGDLEILNIPTIKTLQNDREGSTVIKEITVDQTAGDIQLLRGPIVEALYSGSTNVKLKHHNSSNNANQGNLDIYVINQFNIGNNDNTPGWLVWKDIEVDPNTGEHIVKRGPVVEYISPKYTDVSIQNVYITPHNTSPGHLDIAIKQHVDSMTYTNDPGYIVVKNVEITNEGNLILRRGPVVETLEGTDYTKVYIAGSTTVEGTQGNLAVRSLIKNKVRYLWTGTLDTGTTVDVYRDDGALKNTYIREPCSVVKSFIRISSSVTQGSLTLYVYVNSDGTDRELSELRLSLDNINNDIYNQSQWYSLDTVNLQCVPRDYVWVRLTTDDNFEGYTAPNDPNDLYTIEVVLWIVERPVE